MKLSYSCTPNFKSIISAHNKRILETPPADDQQTCSCPRSAKATCPLDGNCLTRNIVYKATVTAESAPTMNYIGLASTTFKERLGCHTLTFNHERYEHGSELSKHIWKLKRRDISYSIKWAILQHASPYNPASKLVHRRVLHNDSA